MTSNKIISYSRIIMVLLNFVAVIFNVTIFLVASKYIVEQGQSHELLERLTLIPESPVKLFFSATGLYFLLVSVIHVRSRLSEQQSVFSIWLSVFEILLMLLTFVSMQMTYNGLILLVLMDIFYSFRESLSSRARFWLAFIVFSFVALLISDETILSLLMPFPKMATYLEFFPRSSQVLLLFLKTSLTSLNLIVFIISLVLYILRSLAERQDMEEKLEEVSKVNTELNSYVALTEKIAEDRERKRIARELHDTLGHALTGISAGIDATTVLVDVSPERAKQQLTSVSHVVRDSIKDVRRSLNKLRPDILEKQTLEGALRKIIKEYRELSNLNITLDYGWGKVDLDTSKEDIIFRAIQESITNSLRHGHAGHVQIKLFLDGDYIVDIQDDGIGFKELTYGYGLTQMKERLAIIGGSLMIDGKNGFHTRITIPKTKGEGYD